MEQIEAIVKKADTQATAIKIDVDVLAKEARELDVIDDDTYGKASDLLKHLKGKKDWLDTDRKSLTKPLDDAKTAIMGRYKPQIEEIDILIKAVDKKCFTYKSMVETKRRIEEAKRREEEQKALEQHRQNITEAAIETGSKELFDEAKEVVKQQEAIASAPVEIVKAKGAGAISTLDMKDNWKYEVLDESKVPAHLKATDKDLVNDAIKKAVKAKPALKGTLEFTNGDAIPGLRIYNVPSSVSR